MKSVLTFFLCILYMQVMSQPPDYCVYLVSGEIIVSGKGRKPVAVKPRQLIYKADTFTMKKGAEVTLVDMNGSFFVLNTAVNAKTVKELLARSTPVTKDGITTKYLKLLFHELLDPNHDFEKLKKENIAGVWGGVSRGDECGNRIFPVNGLQASVAVVVFKWHKTSPSSKYTFVIYDSESKELLKINTTDTVRSVNINEVLNGKKGKYFWRVTSEDGDCEDEIPIYFTILAPEEEKRLADQLAAGSSSQLESELQQVDKLEKNAFIYAASARYEILAKANPANKALLKSYVLFLLKYGFDEKASEVWNSQAM